MTTSESATDTSIAPDSAEINRFPSGLSPTLVWRHFDALRRIPRPSKKEEKVVLHISDWAAEQGFETEADAAGNLVIRVPARPGFEGAPIVVLQAHLDMVCEKEAGVGIDFERDPISVRVWQEGGETWVGAEGTTLGADNGIGVAMAMAAAVDPDLDRGPLELLFTLDEETGLNGARALDGSLVRGRVMINLDAEEDDGVYIGCAGAAGVQAELAVPKVPPAAGSRPFFLAVRGLKGGHSGIDIHRNRGNAIALLARLLVATLDRGGRLGVASFEGGDKANALAREAEAVIWLDAENEARLRSVVDGLVLALNEQYGRTDPDLAILLRASEATESEGSPPFPASAADSARWLRWLDSLPHGPTAMTPGMPDLVETSVNLASVTTEATEGPGDGSGSAHCRVLCSLRSSNNPALDGLGQSIASLCRLAGAEVERLGGYAGWRPDLSSPLLARTAEVYRRLFDSELEPRAVHAGVECGVVAERVGDLDVVSLGPEILGAHSPEERVSVPSVAKVYRWLSALLTDLAAGSWGDPAD